MKLVDDRTPEQKKTHRYLVAATDKFMSGWGEAQGTASYCAWACKYEHFDRVWNWVDSRPEMLRVREVSSDWKPKRGHTHIYVVDDDHPAVR